MDLNELLKKHADDSGNIGKDKIAEIIKAINSTVGTEFVAKDRYDKKLGEIRELNDKIADLEDASKSSIDWKKKYEDEVASHTATKTAHEGEKTAAGKTAALTAELKAAGANEKAINLMLKGFDLSKIEIDNDGKVKEADKLIEPFKIEYADFFGTVTNQGVPTGTPPANAGTGTNPFAKDSLNLTEQMKLIKRDPGKAREFAKQAGAEANF